MDASGSLHLGYCGANHYFGIGCLARDLATNVYTRDPNVSISLPERDLRKASLFYEARTLDHVRAGARRDRGWWMVDATAFHASGSDHIAMVAVNQQLST